MNDQQNFDHISSEIMSIFIANKLNLNMIYFYLSTSLCSFSYAVKKDLKEILSDIEIIYKSLPPPIEDIDDNADQQSNRS